MTSKPIPKPKESTTNRPRYIVIIPFGKYLAGDVITDYSVKNEHKVMFFDARREKDYGDYIIQLRQNQRIIIKTGLNILGGMTHQEAISSAVKEIQSELARKASQKFDDFEKSRSPELSDNDDLGEVRANDD